MHILKYFINLIELHCKPSFTALPETSILQLMELERNTIFSLFVSAIVLFFAAYLRVAYIEYSVPETSESKLIIALQD